MNKTVILKDREGNNIYPKVPYTNVFGIPHPINEDINIFYGDGVPSTDATQFENINEGSLYFNTQNIDIANDNIFLYKCDGITDNIITWRPITDYALEILHNGIIDINKHISWKEVTTSYAGKAKATNVNLPANQEINITLPPRTIISLNGTTKGNASTLKIQHLTFTTDDITSYTIEITSAVSTYSEILENIEIYISINNYISGKSFIDHSIYGNSLAYGASLINKIFNTEILDTYIYGTGTVTYEDGKLTINYAKTGTSTYNGGGFKIRLYKGNIKTVVKAHIDSESGFNYNNWFLVKNDGTFVTIASVGGTCKKENDDIIITIPSDVVDIHGDEIFLVNTKANATSDYVVLSKIKIFAGNALDADIDSNYLGDFLEALALPKYKNKKILFLGDSVTASKLPTARYWVGYFNEIIKPSLYVNVAVPSSRYCDYSDTIYDGNPVWDGEDHNHNNVIGNQVEKIWRGKDPEHPNYSKVDEYQDFDIIIIAAGSNDSSSSFDADIEPAFTNNNTPVDLSNVNRTTFAGAFRYSVETLQRLYPNAKIFICTPIQAVDIIRPYSGMNTKRNYLKDLANRISVEYIDTFECGICGIYENYHANGRDLVDGLHPNASGAKKIAKYNVKNVINKYI